MKENLDVEKQVPLPNFVTQSRKPQTTWDPT